MKIRLTTHRLLFTITTMMIFTTVLVNSNELKADVGTASSGNWDQTTTWVIGGVNRLPDCGDTLTIPAGVTVTIGTMENYYYCTQGMLLLVQGTLQLVDGFKLRLPCGSSVAILPGGIVKKSTAGGGNSTFIHICHCDAWNAAMGNVTGPDILTCSVLPVSLLSFTAELKYNSVSLEWATATEVNNDYFEVQRSTDGSNFETIKTVRGHGNSNERIDYSFIDNYSLAGITYYRLRQVDFDGAFSYSDIIPVKSSANKALDVQAFYSKSAGINIFVHDTRREDLTIAVYDLFGRNIFSSDISVTGTNEFLLPANLSAGSYLLRIFNSNEAKTIRLQVN